MADKLMHHPGATLANFPSALFETEEMHMNFKHFILFLEKTFIDGSRDEGWT